MVSVPLGQSAYKRDTAGEPEIRLLNRFLEANPTNQTEQVALLARPGSVELAEVGPGPIRGLFTQKGAFGDSMFIVSGNQLWRYSTDDVQTQITGIVGAAHEPSMAVMSGAGYQYLFISDGLVLQYYGGGSLATGTLTESGTITNQVIRLGLVYYTWDAAVDSDPLASGTATHPYRALLGGTDAASLVNMAALINFDGVRGVDFSSTVTGPNAEARITTITATTIVASSVSDGAAGNTITSTVISGAGLAWTAATLLGGNVHDLIDVTMPEGRSAISLTPLASHILVVAGQSQRFYWLEPGDVVIDPLNFAEAESEPDRLLKTITVGDQAWMIGQSTTEPWYATGDLLAPFAPTAGRVFARGSIDNTVGKLSDDVILIGDNGVVYSISGGADRISNHGIEERIRKTLRVELGV
jgi:hypothetical protein